MTSVYTAELDISHLHACVNDDAMLLNLLFAQMLGG